MVAMPEAFRNFNSYIVVRKSLVDKLFAQLIVYCISPINVDGPGVDADYDVHWQVPSYHRFHMLW